MKLGVECGVAFISAVKLSEVWCKSIQLGKQPIAVQIIQAAGIAVMPFGEEEAAIAALLRAKRQAKGISFADWDCPTPASMAD